MKGGLVLISLALLWFVRPAWACMTLCVFLYAYTLALTSTNTSGGRSRRPGPHAPSKPPSELGQEPQGPWLGFHASTQQTWPKGCLVISQNQLSPRGQRSGCWVTQKNDPFPRRLLPKKSYSQSGVAEPWHSSSAQKTTRGTDVLLGVWEA